VKELLFTHVAISYSHVVFVAHNLIAYRFEEEKRGPFGNVDSDPEADLMQLLPKEGACSDSQDSENYRIDFDDTDRIKTNPTYENTPSDFNGSKQTMKDLIYNKHLANQNAHTTSQMATSYDHSS